MHQIVQCSVQLIIVRVKYDQCTANEARATGRRVKWCESADQSVGCRRVEPEADFEDIRFGRAAAVILFFDHIHYLTIKHNLLVLKYPEFATDGQSLS